MMQQDVMQEDDMQCINVSSMAVEEKNGTVEQLVPLLHQMKLSPTRHKRGQYFHWMKQQTGTLANGRVVVGLSSYAKNETQMMFGLFAAVDFHKGDPITMYGGERIVSQDELDACKRRRQDGHLLRQRFTGDVFDGRRLASAFFYHPNSGTTAIQQGSSAKQQLQTEGIGFMANCSMDRADTNAQLVTVTHDKTLETCTYLVATTTIPVGTEILLRYNNREQRAGFV